MTYKRACMRCDVMHGMDGMSYSRSTEDGPTRSIAYMRCMGRVLYAHVRVRRVCAVRVVCAGVVVCVCVVLTV